MEASSSTGKQAGASQDSEEQFQGPKTVPPPVQGVPVAAAPPVYYPEQYYANRPLGYGSYSTQGAPGTSSYPYYPPVPTSFEVHETRPQEPLPCLCGIQLVL
jgi:hypothetical protein